MGLDGVLERAGANPPPIWQGYRDREPVEPSRWDDDPENDYPEFAISHPALQNATIAAAKAAGAEILRPLPRGESSGSVSAGKSRSKERKGAGSA